MLWHLPRRFCGGRCELCRRSWERRSPNQRELHICRPRLRELVLASLLRGRRGGALERFGEVQATAAECDGTEREPGPAEHETCDDVREPMRIEQDSTRRDRDGDCAGTPREQCPDPRAPPAGENQRECGVERRSRRGMPAGEGRAKRL